MCANANAKSPLWNSFGTDHRGSDLENLLIDYKLNVAKQPLESLEFIPGGTSFVDLTLTGDRINLSRWLFLATPSLSDHPYVYFEVTLSSFVQNNLATPKRLIPSPPLKDHLLHSSNKDTLVTNLSRAL